MNWRVMLVACAACTTAPTDEVTETPRPARVSWRTVATMFRADAVEIDAAGLTFHGPPAPTSLNPGPTAADDTTLEAIWEEHGVEMRLNVYLHRDAAEWWADEIRTYDGAAQGEWITYTGDFFRSPLTEPFAGDVEVGGLRLRNVFMKSFLEIECAGAYTIEPFALAVTLRSGSVFGLPARLRDANCVETEPPAGATFEWTIDAAAIARASPAEYRPTGTYLQGGALGATMATVTMRDADGAQLASHRFPIEVIPN